MMTPQAAVYFGDTQKMLARALYDAGKTDTEIGLEIGVSVNNIIHWRRETGLSENGAPQKAEPDPDEYEAIDAPPVVHVAPPLRDERLLSAEDAQAAYIKPAQPAPAHALDIGVSLGNPAYVDLEELMTTRLLIQGNSGSGKSHLLRKLLEESARRVQQAIIDPEGDFVSLGDVFGHTIVDGRSYSLDQVREIAGRVREHRGSVVLNLEDMDAERQMEIAAAFLGGLFDAPREHWYPVLVAIDEAQIFAPASDTGESKETRKASQQAMIDLMCRGRKRGLAGIVATQRLAKLHKNVAAEASNFLMGRTFLDIDISRAGDLVGLPARSAEQIRDLRRGEFLGLGPAISRRPLKITVGGVQTAGKATACSGMAPPPSISGADMSSLLLPPAEGEPTPSVPLRLVK